MHWMHNKRDHFRAFFDAVARHDAQTPAPAALTEDAWRAGRPSVPGIHTAAQALQVDVPAAEALVLRRPAQRAVGADAESVTRQLQQLAFNADGTHRVSDLTTDQLHQRVRQAPFFAIYLRNSSVASLEGSSPYAQADAATRALLRTCVAAGRAPPIEIRIFHDLGSSTRGDHDTTLPRRITAAEQVLTMPGALIVVGSATRWSRSAADTNRPQPPPQPQQPPLTPSAAPPPHAPPAIEPRAPKRHRHL